MVAPAIREEAISKDTGVVRPWEIEPYRLISWWDMERFSAAGFNYIAEQLAKLAYRVGELPRDLDAKELAVSYEPLFRRIREHCASLGLRTSVLCIDDFLADLGYDLTVQKFGTHVAELGNTIRREMWACYFFHMPSSQAEFYDQKELFGAEVNLKFPTVQYDMVEAGNCYAMGRGTACVFHLMRIMETGVQEFGKKLGVPFTDQKNWQNILDESNKALKALPSKDPATIALGQASAHLFNVKLAWRNEVMHPNDKYTLEEAKDLIAQVRLFMVQLASII